MVLVVTQIGIHQDSYEAVAPLSLVSFVCGEDMSFPTIGTDSNGPLAASHHHIAGVAYDYDVR